MSSKAAVVDADQSKLDIDRLKEYKDNKKLKCQVHPVHSLYIWNYAETIQYSKDWDDITLRCRGLVTDFNGNVVAQCFPKFFNFEENQHTATDNYRCFNKMDGSLGILFHYNDEWIFASRGSFASEQSAKAMEMLQAQHPNYVDLDKTKSYIFEIIYPENRIVVNYFDDEKLIYLSSFEPNGTEFMLMNEMKDLGQ